MSRRMNFWEFLDENLFYILWVGLIAACLYFGHQEEMRKPVHKVTSQDTLENEQLNSWYRGANESYFGNSLPKNVTVQWGDLTKYNYVGALYYRPDGSQLIVIDRANNPTKEEAELTEYHEICHIKTYISGMSTLDAHGPKFQACMLQLANQGAFRELW